MEPTDPSTGAGVVETPDDWRVAQDPGTFAVGAPHMAGLLAGAGCPVVMARGEHDAMVSDADLAALVPGPVTLPGLGHNAHVENPGAVVDLVRRCLESLSPSDSVHEAPRAPRCAHYDVPCIAKL